jgi:hypothetical protein
MVTAKRRADDKNCAARIMHAIFMHFRGWLRSSGSVVRAFDLARIAVSIHESNYRGNADGGTHDADSRKERLRSTHIPEKCQRWHSRQCQPRSKHCERQ